MSAATPNPLSWESPHYIAKLREDLQTVTEYITTFRQVLRDTIRAHDLQTSP